MKCVFRGIYQQVDQARFKMAQEEDLQEISKYLDSSQAITDKITYHVFDTREGKQNADPNHSISRASARTEEMAIYRFWTTSDDPHFPHEITHLIAHAWAEPYEWETDLDTWDNKVIRKTIKMVSTSFMQEGLAIAVDDIVFHRRLLENGELKFIDEWCQTQLDQIPTLDKCVNMAGFNSLENKVVVPFSASLSKYLLRQFGLPRYKNMYIQIKETFTPQQNVAVIENVYQKDQLTLLTEWEERLSA